MHDTTRQETGPAEAMRAAILAAPGEMRVCEAPLRNPKHGEVRIKLEGCGVCASNIPPWEGRDWFTYPMEPGQLGHEGWGAIDALGDGVEDLDIGDRVAFLSNNAYSEYDFAPAGAVVKLPESLNGKPFPGEPLGCAMNIFKRSEIRSGDTVAIVGLGFLGCLLTQLATHAGAHVIAIARKPYALAMASRMGASQLILFENKEDVIAAVREQTAGKFCDVVIECTGKQDPLDLSAEITKERGRLIIAGFHQDGPRAINMFLWNWRGLDVINAHERAQTVYLQGIREAIHAVEQGIITPDLLYTHRLPLDQLGQALDLSKDRPDGFMKALVVMQ
jgi:threonine dehydrogenase-like Zn-dependent dehydrogenase